MKVTYDYGDITDISEGIVVHGVNCQGVMGSGVAKALCDKYPLIYDSYKLFVGNYSRKQQDLLGKINPVEINPNLIIINAFTQLYYGRDSKRYVSYDAITDVFERVGEFYVTAKQLPIYFPTIGAGLGGGNWLVIEAIIQSALTAWDVPHGTCVHLGNLNKA